MLLLANVLQRERDQEVLGANEEPAPFLVQ